MPQPLACPFWVGRRRNDGKNKTYLLTHILGSGSFGKVYLQSNLNAVKVVDLKFKPQYQKDILKRQIECLKLVQDNQNVVQMFDFFQQDEMDFIVMQYCQTDLAKKIGNIPCDQKTAYKYLIQILNGYSHLRSKKIVHRDIKLQNILIKGDVLKIADFGFSKVLGQNEHILKSQLGSPIFSAPEILEPKFQRCYYTSKCDIWSIGILFYKILTAHFPWNGKNEQELCKNRRRKPIEWNANLIISSCTKNLVSRMLTFNQYERIDWDELKEEAIKNQILIKERSRPLSFQNNPARRKIYSERKASKSRPHSQNFINIPTVPKFNIAKNTQNFQTQGQRNQTPQKNIRRRPNQIRPHSSHKIQTKYNNNYYQSPQKKQKKQAPEIFYNPAPIIYIRSPICNQKPPMQKTQTIQNNRRPPKYQPAQTPRTIYVAAGVPDKITGFGPSARDKLKQVISSIFSQQFASKMIYLNYFQMKQEQKCALKKALSNFGIQEIKIFLSMYECPPNFFDQ